MGIKDSFKFINEWILEMIIKGAITFEDDNLEFYRKLKSMIKNEKTKKLLDFVINDEKDHISDLKLLLKQDIDEVIKNVDNEKINFYENKFKKDKILADSAISEESIIQMAEERENAFIEYYTLLSQKTNITAARKLFKYLVEEEKKHKRQFQTEIARLKKIN